MSYSRYNRRKKKKNEDTLYDELFEKRAVDFINHYTTPAFKEDKNYLISELNIVFYVWGLGDKLYKLAEKHYNDPSLWWVIAQFNKKPLDSYFKEGDTIMIPLEVEKTIRFMGV